MVRLVGVEGEHHPLVEEEGEHLRVEEEEEGDLRLVVVEVAGDPP